MLKRRANEFDAARRRFLRGGSRAFAVSRPPWAVAEARFTELCTRCDACIDACPEQILAAGSGGLPELDFGKGGCTFCGACVTACEAGALAPSVSPPVPWTVTIGRDCLATRGVMCRSCTDECESRAIRFRLLTGGRAEVSVTERACNGCGACIRLCPVGAIRLHPESQRGEAA